MIITKTKIQILIFLFIATSVFADNHNKKNNKLDTFLKDTFIGFEKSIFRSGKTLEKEIISTLSRIEKECCAKNFENESELKKIEYDIKESYEQRNHMKPITNLDFRKSKKYILQTNLKKAENLLLQNTKQKLRNEEEISKKFQQSQANLNDKLRQANKDKKKLQEEIERIIINYDDKIAKLEKENEQLTNEMSNLEKKIIELAKENDKSKESWWNKKINR